MCACRCVISCAHRHGMRGVEQVARDSALPFLRRDSARAQMVHDPVRVVHACAPSALTRVRYGRSFSTRHCPLYARRDVWRSRGRPS
jgi:hypothetical protein